MKSLCGRQRSESMIWSGKSSPPCEIIMAKNSSPRSRQLFHNHLVFYFPTTVLPSESPIFRPSWSSNPNHSFKDYHCAFLSSAHLATPAVSIIHVIISVLMLTHCTSFQSPHGRGKNPVFFIWIWRLIFVFRGCAIFQRFHRAVYLACPTGNAFPQNASK